MNLFKKVFIIIFFLGVFSAFSLPVVHAQELGETTCNSAIPVESINLFKVDTTRTSATIFFTLPKDTITGYTVSYGLLSDATGYSEHFIAEPHNNVVMFTVDNLAEDATFYFKVRSENGCASGPWSTIRQSGYPNNNEPRLPTTAGESNYILWIGLAGIVCSLLGAGMFVVKS